MNIKIAITKTKTFEVDADVKDGLAVHKTVMFSLVTGEVSLSELFYTITHVGTGYSVMKQIHNKKDALKLRDKFLKLTDWNQEIKPDKKDKVILSIKKQVNKIVDDYRGKK